MKGFGLGLRLCCYYNRNVLVSCSFAKMFVFVRVWGFVCVLVFVCIYVRIRVCILFWGTIFIPVLILRLHKYSSHCSQLALNSIEYIADDALRDLFSLTSL